MTSAHPWRITWERTARRRRAARALAFDAPLERLEPRLLLTGAFPLTTIALEDDPAPGFDVAATFRDFETPSVTNNGQFFFGGQVNTTGGITTSDNEGLFVGPIGAMQLIAREGDPAPGTGANYLHFQNPVATPAGHVSFRGQLDADGTEDYGLFLRTTGSVQLLAREGSSAPGGGVYEDNAGISPFLNTAHVNPAGQAALLSDIDGEILAAVFSGTPGNVQLVANKQQFGATSVQSLAGITDTGQVVFFANQSIGDSAIVGGSPGNVQTLFIEGGDAPGIDLQSIRSFEQLGNVNGAGQFTFIGNIFSSETFDDVIWLGDLAGNGAVIARDNDPAPGTQGRFGGTASTSFGDPYVGPGGHIAFVSGLRPFATNDGTVTTADDVALFVGTPGNLSVLAREGMAAPGLPSDVVFASTNISPNGSLTFSRFAANASGQFMLYAKLEGPNVDLSNDNALFVTDPSGVLQLVVREGDVIEVAPGDSRTVASIDVGGYTGVSSTPNANPLNDAGQLVFGLSFIGSTFGIFATNTAGPVIPKADLGDFVWHDLNGNGTQDAGEPGIEGVTINLLGSTGTLIDSTTTDAAGAYVFPELAAGNYQIEIAPANFNIGGPLEGLLFTARNVGADDTADSDIDAATGRSDVFAFSGTGPNLSLDAGLFALASIGDFVFDDADADGVQDAGEVGIGGVQVQLLDAQDNVVDTTTTAADGFYAFTNLSPGDYTLAFARPASLSFSPKDQGGDDTFDSDADATGRTATFTLLSGVDDVTRDAGLFQSTAIGDFVWRDDNENGVQDAGEVGVEGVTVHLISDLGGDLEQTTTDSVGFYAFTELAPGDYAVRFDLPTGHVFTTRDVGGDDELDSDADETTGQTPLITLASGEVNETLDAGLVLDLPDLDPLKLVGDFEFDEQEEEFFATGTIQVGLKPTLGEPFRVLLFVDGSVTFDESTIEMEGTFRSGIGGLNKPLFVGSMTIPVGSAESSFVNDTSPMDGSIPIAGAELLVAKVVFVNPGSASTSNSQIEVEGEISFFDEFFHLVGTTDPLALPLNEAAPLIIKDAGMEIESLLPLPPSLFTLFDSITLKVTDVSAKYEGAGDGTDKLILQGKLEFPDIPKHTIDLTDDNPDDSDPGNRIEITSDPMGGVSVALKGKLTFLDIEFLGFKIADGELFLDTTGNDAEIKGKATLFIPPAPPEGLPDPRIGLIGELGFLGGEWNTFGIGVDGLHVPLGTTGLELNKVFGSFDNFAESDPDPLALTANVGITDLFPTIPLPLPNFLGGRLEADLLNIDLTGTIDVVGLRGVAKVAFVGGYNDRNLAELEGSATLNWEQNFLSLRGGFKALALPGVLPFPLLSGSAAIKVDSNVNVTGKASGTLTLPRTFAFPIALKWVAGLQASATGMIRYFNNDTYSDDFIAAWGSIPILGQQLGIKVAFDGTVSLLGAREIRASTASASAALPLFADGLAPLATTGPLSESFTIDADTNWAVFAAEWQNPSSSVAFRLIDPTGAILTEEDIAANPDINIPDGAATPTDIAIQVNSPAAGVWTLEILETDGLGDVTFGAVGAAALPQVAITNLTSDTTPGDDGLVSIDYEAFDADSDAVVRFFYDDDNLDQDGALIDIFGDDAQPIMSRDSVIESDGAGSIVWNTNGLAPGDYYVYAVIEDETNPAVFSEYSVGKVTIAAAGDGIVSGAIYDDDNENGQRDAGEAGAADVLVELYEDTNDTGSLDTGDIRRASHTTGADGAFTFANLAPGNYFVDVSAPNDYVLTTGDDPVALALESGGAAAVEIGYQVTPAVDASIGGVIFDDINGNGYPDDDTAPGIDGVEVTLIEAGDDGLFDTSDDAGHGASTTANGGLYAFTDLPAGRYRASVTSATVPAGYTLSSASNEFVIDLGESEVRSAVDFGYRIIPATALIGDRVFLDVDGDGVQDIDEPGVEGVTVELFTADDALIDEMTTDASGAYLFADLLPDDYYVRFTLPASFAFTAQDQGGDDAIDSDANPDTGRTDLFALGEGEADLTRDAGVAQLAIATIGKEEAGGAKQTLIDNLGNAFDFSYSGVGRAMVFMGGDGRFSLSVEDSDAKSSLTIKPKSGDATIDSIKVAGDFKSVAAKSIHLLGDIDVLGYVASFTAGNIADQHLVAFGGAATDKPTKAVFENLTNVTMTSGAPIDLTVLSWTDDDHALNPDSLTAPSAKKITVKGDRKNNIAALWEADVTLTGEGNPKATLGAFTSETVREAAFDITGDAGGFTIKGDVSDASFTVHSVMKKFSASGALSNVTMDYDEFGSIAAASWDTGVLTAIFGKSLDLKSNKNANDPGDLRNVVITLAGVPVGAKAKDTLSKLTAKGATSNVTASIAGSAGSVDLSKGGVDNLTLDVSGGLKSVKLGDVSAADITAGSTGTVQAVRWLDGSAIFADVKTIKTTGDKKTNTPGDMSAAVLVNADGLSTAKSPLGGAKIAGAVTATWRAVGPVGAIAAERVADTFVGLFEGEVKALSSKAEFDGFAAAFAFGKVDVKTTMTGATIIAGSPGSGTNSIGSLKIGGDITGGTRILVGVDPINNIYDDGDDTFKPGDANFIKSMTIGGEAAPDSVFQAGAFPRTVSINKVKVDPLTDPRFIVS